MTELPWPFLGSEALAAKALPERAMRSLYEAIYPDVYVPWGVEVTASQRARAAWLWSRRRAVVAGQSAAALLGARWVDPLQPAELIYANRHPPPLVVVHTETLVAGETLELGGMTVTSAARTAFDIGRRTPFPLAVQRLDALAQATDVKVLDVETVMVGHPGARGLLRLRQVLPLVDGGAESPQETRTRLVLIEAGLPAPRTQIPVFSEYGDLLARVDMGWEEWLVGVEYDGAQHWKTSTSGRAISIDRQNWKPRAGRSSESAATCFATGGAPSSPGWWPRCVPRVGRANH